MYRLGVDVGGTNTDGVLIDTAKIGEGESRGVLAWGKTKTTEDVTSGIVTVLSSLLYPTFGSSSTSDPRPSPSAISSLHLGTTHFINSVLTLDPQRLARVFVIRLCSNYCERAPPGADWPHGLKGLIIGGSAGGAKDGIGGGREIDGRTISPISHARLAALCRDVIVPLGISNVAITGIYSPLDPPFNNKMDGTGGEEEAAVTVKKELTEAFAKLGITKQVNVVCSKTVGQVGFLSRESATILNAAILPYAQRTIRSFKRAMKELDLKCPLYLTQNDGTLITADEAAKIPIRTFASGQTNSMRGASFLAGLESRSSPKDRKPAIVVDIGGTTTDVGVLLPSGFPRVAGSFIEIGGVRTNFSMPDVQSIGLGGGSLVRSQESGRVTVGPDSVGLDLTSSALVFGGDTLTATDVLVASKSMTLGDPTVVRSNLSSKFISDELVQATQKTIGKMLESVIDKMKTSADDIIVLLVGGGSILAPGKLAGVSEVLMPPFYQVANACGAAMAKVSGEIDTIEILEGRDLNTVIGEMKQKAIEKAIAGGADPANTAIVEVENLPVQYVTNQATRLIIRAVGELSITQSATIETVTDQYSSNAEEEPFRKEEKEDGDDIQRRMELLQKELDQQQSKADIDIDAYRPEITQDREWIVSELDLEWIADGCGILGTGGGGSTYPPFLETRELMRKGGKVRIVDGADVPENSLFVRAMFMGSPSVSLERLQSGTEIPTATRHLLKYLGKDDFTGVISDEIGGGNGLQPLLFGTLMERPVLDGDLMGRAYPNMYQSLPGAFGVEGGLWPAAISDAVGNAIILPSARDGQAVEDFLRGACTTMGSKAGVAMAPLSRKICQDYGVAKSLSQAWRFGRVVAQCRKKNDMKGLPARILELQPGKLLFLGKIVDVQREVRKGFTWGAVTIAPLLDEEQESSSQEKTPMEDDFTIDSRLVIPFQNENLYASLKKSDGSEKILVTVPDLITVLDSQTGTALGTPEYRYGLRVAVIAMAAEPKWTKTKEGLLNGGPSAFGLHDISFQPIAEYVEPQSVIDEFHVPAGADSI